jgi:hypothetical protein
MSEERPTVKGRGAEIFFGAPRRVDIKPRATGEEPAKTGPAGSEDLGGETAANGPPGAAEELPPFPPEELELFLDDPELQRALDEEARASQPDAKAASTVGRPGTRAASTEGAKEAAAQEAVVVEPPAPGAGHDLDEAIEGYEPLAPEISDIVEGVLPPKPRRGYTALSTDDVYPLDIQDPDEKIEPIKLPDRVLTEEERTQILAWLGEEWIQTLESSIDESYDQVRNEVGTNKNITTECYNKLLQARDIVLRRDVAQIAQAEYYVEEVRTRLKRAADSEKAAKRHQWWILIWGLFWFVAFMALQFLINESWFWDTIAPAGLTNLIVDMEIFLTTMLWGGIGGVVAILYSLFKHVGQRDFDPHYKLSYLGKPFLGIILGATTYMVFNLVLRTLGILPAGLEAAEGIADTAFTVAPGVLYLIAWASGFKENTIFELVERTMKRVFGSKKDA